jgi:hypothetical protein
VDFKPESDVTIQEKRADDFLDVARSLALNNRVDEALYYYKESMHLFEELGFKHRLNQLIWELEKVLSGEIKELKYLQYEAFVEYDDVRREIILEKIHSYEDGKNWIEKREELLEKTLSDAKKYADNKKYSKAKIFYARALKFLKELGWNKEIETIRNEIKLIDEKVYVIEQRKKIEQELVEQKKQEREQYFEEEKRKFEAEQRAKAYVPPEPDQQEEMIKKKMQIAEMNKKKAMDAEKAGNYRIALNRYEYLYNLYLELNFDPIQRERIKQKIKEMNDKINRVIIQG